MILWRSLVCSFGRCVRAHVRTYAGGGRRECAKCTQNVRSFRIPSPSFVLPTTPSIFVVNRSLKAQRLDRLFMVLSLLSLSAASGRERCLFQFRRRNRGARRTQRSKRASIVSAILRDAFERQIGLLWRGRWRLDGVGT